MNTFFLEFLKFFIGGLVGAVLGLIVTTLYARKFEVLLSKIFNNRIGNKSSRDISGLWVTQYKYPSMDSQGNYFEKIETQIVLFKQKGNYVVGITKEAETHPEAFEGRITIDRYFTGVYVNTINHQNYHGAFQFIISNGKGRMKGKWIGFDNKGIEIAFGEWRWQQIYSHNKVSGVDLHKIKVEYKNANLFNDAFFIM